MSTVAEITGALPQLTNEELRAIERRLLQEYRERKVGIIFDDAYGVWTEEDQRSVADQMFAVLDADEQKNQKVPRVC